MTKKGMMDKRHLMSLAAAVLAFLAIVASWIYGLSYLDGTPFEELRYLIFAGYSIGVLSGLQFLFSRFTHTP